MRYLLLLMLPLAVLLAGCDGLTDSETAATERITNILEDIEESFNLQAPSEDIMAHYSDDYLHNGDGPSMARLAWDIRSAEYVALELVNIEIELDDDDAVATFEAHFYSTSGQDVFLEPYEHGDYSYFHKENGVWLVYGNQNPGEGNNLLIDSSPDGAKIYLNDTYMHQYTPATLHSVPSGDHLLRLYKAGWNEQEDVISVTETLQLDYTLSLPGYPRPVFDVESPTNGQVTNSATIPVSAIVRTRSENGVLSDFDGSYVIINVNGDETLVSTTGILNTEVPLQMGENEITLRATGASGNTGVSNTFTVTRL